MAIAIKPAYDETVLEGHERVTFVTAVREIEPSHASVLRDWIEARG